MAVYSSNLHYILHTGDEKERKGGAIIYESVFVQ